MRHPFSSPPITRLSVRPDEPRAVVGPRRVGSRRPHADAAVAHVRRLIEQTVLTYSEIAERTGVGRASICRWTRDGGWKRPLFAPRATDTVPSARASAKLKARTLTARLRALAERYVRELEETPGVDLDKLREALELSKMARLADRPKRRRSPAEKAALESLQTWQAPARTVLRSLRAGGVDTLSAPEEALEDFIASRAPPPEKPRVSRARHAKARRNFGWMPVEEG